MITESVKTILGEDLTNQVEAALKGKGKDGKDVDLVVGNDGTFVPAEKYNGANSGKNSAENALKAAAEALKAIGGSGDPAKIADDVKTAQATIETLRTNHQNEERAGELGDFYYSIKLSEWKDYSPRRIALPAEPEQPAQAQEPERTGEPETAKAKTYTVKAGDCLWNIAKQIYGKGSDYTKIYNANKGTIGSNPNLIYPGQVFTIP